jgi:hypothetical protein
MVISMQPANTRKALAPRFALYTRERQHQHWRSREDSGETHASALVSCGTAKVVIIAVEYDQNVDQVMVGSRSFVVGISVGRTYTLYRRSQSTLLKDSGNERRVH